MCDVRQVFKTIQEKSSKRLIIDKGNIRIAWDNLIICLLITDEVYDAQRNIC
jgi:hypothetical protein